MPQFSDSLPNFLSAARREGLRELFLHEVTTVSCTSWRNPAPWQLDWRTCDDTFLLFPLEGRFRVRLRHRNFIVPPGKFLLLPDHTPHALELVRGYPMLRQISLHCHLHDRWRRSFIPRLAQPLGQLETPARTHLALRELTCLMGRDPATAQAYGETLIRELLAAHLRRHPLAGPAHPTGDPRIHHALERMEEGLASAQLSVESLASEVGLTAVQFRKLFRRDTGGGPKQHLQALRLRRATWLLRHTAAPVKDIAARCGFASDHYFHLAFRARFQCTPSAYREDAPL